MAKMTSAATRHFGTVFDDIADTYDQYRSGYPDQLITYACQAGDLQQGDNVLEVGCGSGQLTRALIERGLHVTAIEPGAQLIKRAKEKLKEHAGAQFIQATFEDARVPRESYKAVFSASAFHWVDPDTSWRKAAELLAPDGTLVLIQHFGLQEKRTEGDLKPLLSVLKKIAPEVAAKWPRYYTMDEIMNGVQKRQKNIASAWSWLGDYDLERPYVEQLFSDVHIAARPRIIEQTADELMAVFSTISAYARLSEQQRTELALAYETVYQKLGRPIRSSIVTVVMTARRQ